MLESAPRGTSFRSHSLLVHRRPPADTAPPATRTIALLLVASRQHAQLHCEPAVDVKSPASSAALSRSCSRGNCRLHGLFSSHRSCRIGGAGRSCILSICRGRPVSEDEASPAPSLTAPSVFTKTARAAAEAPSWWARLFVLVPSLSLSGVPGGAASRFGFFLFAATRGWQALTSSIVSPWVPPARASLRLEDPVPA